MPGIKRLKPCPRCKEPRKTGDSGTTDRRLCAACDAFLTHYAMRFCQGCSRDCKTDQMATDSRQCQSCARATKRSSRQAREQRLKTANLCIKCGKEPPARLAMCPTCLEKHYARRDWMRQHAPQYWSSTIRRRNERRKRRLHS